MRTALALLLGLALAGAALAAPAPAPAHRPLVLLDPGHGGPDDRGVRAAGLEEAAFTLDLARRTAAALKERGVDARLTRETDEALPLLSRTAQANLSKAAALVSLHLNWSFNEKARGLRVFVPAAGKVDEPAAPLWEQASRLHAAASKELGQAVAAGLGEGGGRSVQTLKLALFRGLLIPAAEVELDYASSKEAAEALKDPAHVEALSGRLADGIAVWARKRAEAKEEALAPR